MNVPAIKWKVVRRLAITACAAGLLLLTYAYWWQSNLVHEIAGTIMFVLVGRHLYVNRAWFKNLLRGQYDLRRWIITTLHLGLAVNMVLLLVTSVVISQSVFQVLGFSDLVIVRDLHWLGAYWLAVTLGVHLGLNWTRVMALLRASLQIREPSVHRTWILRILALAVVVFGIWSWGVMQLGTKLSWSRSLEFWDFTTSVAPFFLHWAGVIAVPAVLVHALMRISASLPAAPRIRS
jgi:hypothetical protein